MIKIIRYKNKWSIVVDFPYIKFPKISIPKLSLPKITLPNFSFNLITNSFKIVTKGAVTFLTAAVAFVFCGIAIYAVYKVLDVPAAASEVEKNAKIKIQIGKKVVMGFEVGSKTQAYDIMPIPKKEIVQGYRGKYFVIQLFDPENQVPIYFKSGKYSLNEMEEKFVLSVNDFHKNILDKVNVLGARVFIQGKADSLDKNFSSSFVPFDCNSSQVSPFEYHPVVHYANNAFSNSLENYVIRPQIGNNDLPFLRARFLQCKLQSLYQETPIEIVQGDIDPDIQEASRKGTFILYIPEDKK